MAIPITTRVNFGYLGNTLFEQIKFTVGLDRWGSREIACKTQTIDT